MHHDLEDFSHCCVVSFLFFWASFCAAFGSAAERLCHFRVLFGLNTGIWRQRGIYNAFTFTLKLLSLITIKNKTFSISSLSVGEVLLLWNTHMGLTGGLHDLWTHYFLIALQYMPLLTAHKHTITASRKSLTTSTFWTPKSLSIIMPVQHYRSLKQPMCECISLFDYTILC